MSKQLSKFIAAVLLSVSVACSGCAQTETTYDELPNFHQINEHLYRGGQPKAGGIERLAQLGIKTIVDLRADDDRARAEEQEARSAGLSFFNIPMKNLGRPTDEQIQRVLAIIDLPDNQPVFVHCRRGADRTGTVSAVYRIEHDGWTSEQAKKEAESYGMRFWQLGMKNYIRDYYQARLAKGNDK
jgi:uncharacterized protein (TIGR01244 family)